MNSIYLKWWGCGAFDVVVDDVAVSFDPYLFGKNLVNADTKYDYIFISHEHFDHCHVQSLKKLCSGSKFIKLFVSPGCVWPNYPIQQNYGDSAFERDLPITSHIPIDKLHVMYPKFYDDTKQVREWEAFLPLAEINCSREVDLGEITVEAIESGESQKHDIPTCGYLVTHKSKKVSFLHIGDMWKPYPQLEKLKGRVDFLLHMKIGLNEYQQEDHSERLVKLLDMIAPKYLIPLHYRTDRIYEPVPEGHWPPNVTDTFAYVESIRETVGSRVTILPFTAGVEYEVAMPEKKVLWKWNWQNTWDTPKWRDL